MANSLIEHIRRGAGPVAALALMLSLIAGALVPQARAADRDRLEAFLEVTGFDVSLNSIALSAEHAPDMLGMSLSDFGQNWSEMAEEVFAEDIMHDMALDMLEQTLSDELLAHAAEFYASPLGQELVEVENASHMADDEMKVEDGEALLAQYEAEDPARKEIITDLIGAVGSEDQGVRAIHEIQVRFMMAASQAGVLEDEIDEGVLRALLRAGEEDLRAAIRASGLASSAHTYQSIGNDDLQAYVDALKAPKMQEVYELMNAVQHEIMANRFEALADRMAGATLGEEL